MQNQIEGHKIELDNRRKLSVTGVESVDGFSDQVLNLTVIGGIKLKICGCNIKITSYNKASGSLNADGEFNEIKYLGPKTPILQKLFK